MSLRTVMVVLVLAVLALFAALNWTAFMAPTTLSLVVATVHAPLGLIMLGFVGILTALFLAAVVYLQGTRLVDARRYARELQAQRELADRAEASRFTELRAFLDAELPKLRAQSTESLGRLEARLDKLDGDFGAALERTESAMAAYIGELENRVERLGKPAGTEGR